MRANESAMQCYARLGTASPQYQQIKRWVPDEDARNAKRGESQSAYILRRIFYDTDEADLLVFSMDSAISFGRLKRVLFDTSASEVLSIWPFLCLVFNLRLRLNWAHDPLLLHLTGLRRLAEGLLSKRLNRRIRKDDHLSVTDVALFGAVWNDAERRESFLNFYRRYGNLQNVDRSVREQFASDVAAEVNGRLDSIDQEAFGGLVPYPPHVFNRIATLFDRIGLELIVVWDALEEFLPDRVGSYDPVNPNTGLLAYG